MSDVKIKLGKRIKQLRNMRDMTQENLAEAADLSISFLGNVERGNSSPTIETLKKIADALDVTLSELMNFDSDIKTEDGQKSILLHRILLEYTNKIEQLYKN
ncbi:MAG: helix-turn-helix transcriptional regulator [Firmicutes bacterium]|nr:helix-turn-helix transcriptional regulator [Bacillota bacterium]